SLARDGQVYRNLYLSHAPRMPAASVSGLVFSAGEDWILYAYRFETNLGEPPAPAIGFMDLESAGRRADEEALWNPDFRSEEGVLRELRRIEKSILSYSIGTDEPDVLALCSAIVLGWGAHAPGPLPSGPRPPGVRPRALACDILGLLGSPRAVPILIEAYLRDPYPFVRAAAARALGAIGLDVAGEAMRAFRAAAELEYFLDERGAFATIEGVEGIYRAMGNLSDPDGVRAVMRIAGRPFGSAVRSSAQAALRRLFEPARREE
ncbi:MAG TPA: HEAT repeat domain-containing protein, partial [Magnetospirillaceae bacterium]|nr:HEAT repeat domain-containing protein [Magnetospirillaceae bacterium]